MGVYSASVRRRFVVWESLGSTPMDGNQRMIAWWAAWALSVE